MDVKSVVYHRANYYLSKATTSSSEGFTAYVSPLKRPRYAEDPRSLFKPETEGEQFNHPFSRPFVMSLYETYVTQHGHKLGYAEFLDDLGQHWEADAWRGYQWLKHLVDSHDCSVTDGACGCHA